MFLLPWIIRRAHNYRGDYKNFCPTGGLPRPVGLWEISKQSHCFRRRHDCEIRRISLDFVVNVLQKKSFDGRWYFRCRNGLDECLKNKWQACSIHVLPVKLQLLANYLVCYMNSTDEILSGYQVRIFFFPPHVYSTIYDVRIIYCIIGVRVHTFQNINVR